MKKILSCILLILAVLLCFVSCDDNASKKKITPVTPIPPEPITYITFKSDAEFSISPSYSEEGEAQWNGQLFYSTDKNNWVEFTTNTVTTSTSLSTAGSHYLYLRGLGNTKVCSESKLWQLNATSALSCSGNIMNLLDYEKVQQEQEIVMADCCFICLFYGWTNLTDVSELKLPALNLSNYCYSYMFVNTGITSAPELPALILKNSCYASMFGATKITSAPKLIATTLAESCYSAMFAGCSNLSGNIELPVTTLAYDCYSSMFEGCNSLSGTIELPATTLSKNCYKNMFESCSSLNGCVIKATAFTEDANSNGCCENMFKNCSSLNSLTVNFTQWGTDTDLNPKATNEWVGGVASNGTFNCSASLPLNTGTNYIPDGWTVKNGVRVNSIMLDTTSTTIKVGKYTTLTATVLPENAENKAVTWSSSDSTVASVENGVVCGLSEGNAIITVKTKDGNFTTSCNVAVIVPPQITGSVTVNSSSGRTTCDWVQLWKDGPKWATMNVGSTATDYSNATGNTLDVVGGAYAWGSTVDYRSVQTSISDYCTSTTSIKGSAYDTAKNIWGNNWQMPTKDMFSSMTDNLTGSNFEYENSLVTWKLCDGSTTKYTTGCNLPGYKVTGKGDYSNNSIFFPISGFFYKYMSQEDNYTNNNYIDLYYWSSDCQYFSGTPGYNTGIAFYKDDNNKPAVSVCDFTPDHGVCVRAVLVEAD